MTDAQPEAQVEYIRANREVRHALVISDPRELGRRAMQAMRVALSGGSASAYSAQLGVQIVTRETMEQNPIVAMLLQGEGNLAASATGGHQ